MFTWKCASRTFDSSLCSGDRSEPTCPACWAARANGGGRALPSTKWATRSTSWRTWPSWPDSPARSHSGPTACYCHWPRRWSCRRFWPTCGSRVAGWSSRRSRAAACVSSSSRSRCAACAQFRCSGVDSSARASADSWETNGTSRTNRGEPPTTSRLSECIDKHVPNYRCLIMRNKVCSSISERLLLDTKCTLIYRLFLGLLPRDEWRQAYICGRWRSYGYACWWCVRVICAQVSH